MTVSDTADVGSILHSDIDKFTSWAQKWLVKFNLTKSESLVISNKPFKPDHASLLCHVLKFHQLQATKTQIILLSNDGSWVIHINKSIETAWKRVGVIRHLKIRIDRLSLQTIYFSFIRPILEYGDVISPRPIYM